MAHRDYDIFRHHLAIKFPSYGYALWHPGHGNLYPPVEVGDVGYISEGKFHRLFNVLLPANHPSHQNLGVPDYHEQLTLDMADHIHNCNLSRNDLCSANVTSTAVSRRQANGPDEIPEVFFSCPMKEGAVLSLPIQAKGSDTIAKPKFGKFLVKHIDCWFAWARQRDLGVNRMEDIILVTGMHRIRSWTNVAFPGGQEGAQALFGGKADHRGDDITIGWQFSDEHNRGAVLNRGPEGVNLPEDQCIFIRGFRATRRFRILPTRIKAAAGPNPDPEGHDEGSDAELIPIPAESEYRDPLHILIEYIAEAAPNDCNMVLVHDDDLEMLGRIYDSKTPLDSLNKDIVLDNIRSLKPRLDYSLSRIGANSKDWSSAGGEPIWVAALTTIFEIRCYSYPARASLPTTTQGDPDFPEPPAGGGSVQHDHSGQSATVSPPSRIFTPTIYPARTPDHGQQATSVPRGHGGPGARPTAGLSRVHNCRMPGCNRPMYFDRRLNEFWEWCSPQHIHEGLARRMEKPCKRCAVWPRKYGYKYCGGAACNKRGVPIGY